MTGEITDVVRSKYGDIADCGLSSDLPGVRAVARAFRYSEEELRSTLKGCCAGRAVPVGIFKGSM
jgi:hypothetical protein